MIIVAVYDTVVAYNNEHGVAERKTERAGCIIIITSYKDGKQLPWKWTESEYDLWYFTSFAKIWNPFVLNNSPHSWA